MHALPVNARVRLRHPHRRLDPAVGGPLKSVDREVCMTEEDLAEAFEAVVCIITKREKCELVD